MKACFKLLNPLVLLVKLIVELFVLGFELLDLRDGRCTPAYITDELDMTQEYVRNRLGDLQRFGLVNHVYRGLYELNEE